MTQQSSWRYRNRSNRLRARVTLGVTNEFAARRHVCLRANRTSGALHSGVQDTIAPRFALWDAFASQRIGRGLSAFLTVDNLANSKDPNAGVLLPTGAPAPIYRPEAGRTARVGVQWSFAAR